VDVVGSRTSLGTGRAKLRLSRRSRVALACDVTPLNQSFESSTTFAAVEIVTIDFRSGAVLVPVMGSKQ
jgi:hypothetical protein